MKSRIKFTLHLCLIASALVLTACGKKANKVGSGVAGSSLFVTGNPLLNTPLGSTIINQVQSIKANVTCMNGYRLTNDVSFYVNGGSVTSTRIAGNWQSGFMSSGTISKLWIGVSAFRDLMFVTQVSNGGQVLGFNVTLSFCELKNSYSSLPSIISNERAISSFQAPYGIILDSNTYCGYSVIDLAKDTFVTSERDLSNPYSPPTAQIPTSYTKPSCNGQF